MNPLPALIDSHSHIDTDAFDTDRAAVIARAVAAGVGAQVVPAITAAGWQALHALCQRTPGLYPAYGLHPMYLAEHRRAHLDDLALLLERVPAVAVGECGLDHFVDGLDRDEQRHYFERQLVLAKASNLPVILHARRAFDEVAAGLRRIGGLRGVVHSFSGSPEQAERFWHLGFCLGIGGPVTYPRAQRLRALVARMPIEFLLLETDAPDQPLHGHQGERNEPARLAEVLESVAQLRNQEPTEIAAATRANAERIFDLASFDARRQVHADD